MKKILLYLLLVNISLAGSVAVTDSGEVVIDGINAGRMCDVVCNYPSRLTEIKSAVEAKVNANCTKNPKFCKAVVDALEVKVAIDPDVKATLDAKVKDTLDKEAAAKAAQDAQDKKDADDAKFFK